MLIGLCGRIGSGKSHVSGILKTYNFKELSFAEPLKQIGEILGFTYNELYINKNDINNTWNISGRTFLQKFGTDIMRDSLVKTIPSMDNVWIKLLNNKLIKHKNEKIVISDVRFQDEYDLIKSHGGIIIQMEIDEPVYGYELHKSEGVKLNPDYIIFNNKKDDTYIKDILHKILSYYIKF